MTQPLFMLLKDCFMRLVRAVGGPGEECEGRLHTHWCLQQCLMIVPSYAGTGMSLWRFSLIFGWWGYEKGQRGEFHHFFYLRRCTIRSKKNCWSSTLPQRGKESPGVCFDPGTPLCVTICNWWHFPINNKRVYSKPDEQDCSCIAPMNANGNRAFLRPHVSCFAYPNSAFSMSGGVSVNHSVAFQEQPQGSLPHPRWSCCTQRVSITVRHLGVHVGILKIF